MNTPTPNPHARGSLSFTDDTARLMAGLVAAFDAGDEATRRRIVAALQDGATGEPDTDPPAK